MIQIQDTNTNTLHTIGQIITEFKPSRNAFIDTLVNRIAMVMVTSRTWDNPWSVFKRGTLALGESIEEVFVNIAKPFDFNPDTAEKRVFRREFPDIRVTFHRHNYQKFYKVTISQQQLRIAFLAWSGITDLVTRIIDTLYTAMNYDEYISMKYMLCRAILNGGIGGYKVADFTSNANLGDLIASVRGTVNNMEFLSNKYNSAGVMNASGRGDVYCFIDTYLDARVDVNVLAAAFNMDRAEFTGRRILIDGWANHDTARLAELFGNDPEYSAFTESELAVLGGIGAVVADRDVWMCFDNLEEMESINNGEGLYYNYWLHCWRTFAMSPFANAVAFTMDTFSVTGVTITGADGGTPATSVGRGRSAQYAATVAGSGTYNNAVTWSLSGQQASGTYIMGGTLRVATDETASTLTLTATSIADPTEYDTETITVVGNGVVTGVTISPTTATVAAGATRNFTATVAGSGDYAETVTWSVTGGGEGTSVSSSGVLTVAAGETAETLTVTATSTQDPTKSASATVTVGS